MRLTTYLDQGAERFGAVLGDGIVDLHRALGGRYADLRGLLADQGGQGYGLEAARACLAQARPDVALVDVQFLPVIPRPGKIWCCGLNFHAHIEECQAAPTGRPTFFLRVADSQIGHGQPLLRPRESQQLDYEAEIAVVIGRGGRRIREDDAAAHIAGYACYNDASVRDWQLATTQWDAGKNFWRTGAFGPWMVTADEIPFGTPMTLTTRLNGRELQRASTALMVHGIARQIAYLSTIAPLEPGDVIVTGTPGGIGAMRQPPVWMQPGDVVEVEVDRIGILRNTVADDPA